MFSSPMTSSNKLGWPTSATELKPEDYWIMSKKDDQSSEPSDKPIPMPWSGEMENLRKKNAAAKLKASLAEEVVDLSGQIEDDEDSDDIAADEVSVRELPNDPWKK